MSEKLTSLPLWGQLGCYVPSSVGVCPECGGEIIARAMSHELETGRPIASDIELDCLTDLKEAHLDRNTHRWHQSDWRPVRDAVIKWTKADDNQERSP